MPLPLSDRTLGWHGRKVRIPRYDRRALVPAVAHMSVGSFHRSHQAVYLDELAQRGHTGWGLTGIGLRRRTMADALLPQDGLYTVVERGARGDRPRVVGVMGRYCFAPADPAGTLASLVDPRTRLVTLTVTGAAYHLDPVTGAFDARHPEVIGDLRAPAPRSALGLLVAALEARRRARQLPFTVLSCDNMPLNGRVTRQAVVAFARLRDPDLASWIEEHVAFPSSMVDRITPETTDEDRARLAREFGVIDRWPVMTEPFTDWVIEDAFSDGRPPLDEVGVRFVSDVRPYSLAKTRMLNASHLVLGVLGRQAGRTTMPELMTDPVFRAYAEALMGTEIAPALPPSAIDLPAYRRLLIERLANPRMQDQLGRLSRGIAHKFPRHVVPSVLAARDAGRPHPLLTVAVAGVCRHLGGGADPRPLLADAAMFGTLGDDDGFVVELERVLEALDRDGVRATVARALATDQLTPA